MLLLTLSLLGCSLALRQCFKACTPLAQRPIILMLLQLLATAQWSSWLLALTFVLLAHMLLALPLAVAASAPSWQLDTSTWSDGVHWCAVVAFVVRRGASVRACALTSVGEALAVAVVRARALAGVGKALAMPRGEEGYRTVSGSCIGKPIFELLAALGTYLVVHDGHAEATRRGASGCWRGDAAATSGGGACACVWAV